MDHEHEIEPPFKTINTLTRIVMLALAIALLALSVVAVIVAVNGRSTQLQNENLTDELRCLRPAQFDFDEASASIQLDLARGIGALVDGDNLPSDLGDSLKAHAAALAKAINDRSQSLVECKH